jgi:hypothetical protein
MGTRLLILVVLFYGCGGESVRVDQVKQTDIAMDMNLDAGINLDISLIDSKSDKGITKSDSLKYDTYSKPDSQIGQDSYQAQDSFTAKDSQPDTQLAQDTIQTPDIENPKPDNSVPKPDVEIPPQNCKGPCQDAHGHWETSLLGGGCRCVLCEYGNLYQYNKDDNVWRCVCDPIGHPPIVCEGETICNPTLKKCVCPKTPNTPCNGGYCSPQCYWRIYSGLYQQCPDDTEYQQGSCYKRTVP